MLTAFQNVGATFEVDLVEGKFVNVYIMGTQLFYELGSIIL